LLILGNVQTIEIPSVIVFLVSTIAQYIFFVSCFWHFGLFFRLLLMCYLYLVVLLPSAIHSFTFWAADARAQRTNQLI